MQKVPLVTQLLPSMASSPRNPQPDLETLLQTPFHKTIRPYLDHRNDGDVCLNCLSFFVRASRDFSFHPQVRAIKVSVFVKCHGIIDLASFVATVSRLMQEERMKGIFPTFSRQECVFETRLSEQFVDAVSANVNNT